MSSMNQSDAGVLEAKQLSFGFFGLHTYQLLMTPCTNGPAAGDMKGIMSCLIPQCLLRFLLMSISRHSRFLLGGVTVSQNLEAFTNTFH